MKCDGESLWGIVSLTGEKFEGLLSPERRAARLLSVSLMPRNIAEKTQDWKRVPVLRLVSGSKAWD